MSFPKALATPHKIFGSFRSWFLTGSDGVWCVGGVGGVDIDVAVAVADDDNDDDDDDDDVDVDVDVDDNVDNDFSPLTTRSFPLFVSFSFLDGK